MTKLALALMVCLMSSLAQGAPLLPVPPIPPGNPPPNDAAPVPNGQVRDPSVSQDELRFGLHVSRATRPDTSLGFAPGSRYQPYEERKPLQTPGFRVTVPLQ